MKMLKATTSLTAALLLAMPLLAQANEAVIRKNLAERLASLPKVDEVKQSPMPGLWEIRIGNEIRYTDATGTYLIEGELIDLRTRKNLTEERVIKLQTVDFASLPLKDAVVWKTGDGKRRIAIFSDPNCGYCKRFERSLQDVKDLTVYTFLIPILGGDSPEKARSVWCAKDSTATWRAWMLDGKAPAKPMGACDDSAIERNLALSKRSHVSGTPAIIFEDGSRAPGALSAEQLEKRLQAVGKS
ncbi:DsbC family protein [Paucibacter sp. TC2R-5]|uniref:DsbC family protein n=1 Tax=Paucibacter sp. TC2R-5 TaxID=2893555 RepID=UPI0021E4FB97|nr:DsbC family protein [Paucibacter sp. TC2R-5]MCV2359806.1 DsbC family protein [Paucibacter sp. TC2R-5]